MKYTVIKIERGQFDGMYDGVIDDESGLVVIDEGGSFWPADEFFQMEGEMEFYTE